MNNGMLATIASGEVWLGIGVEGRWLSCQMPSVRQINHLVRRGMVVSERIGVVGHTPEHFSRFLKGSVHRSASD